MRRRVAQLLCVAGLMVTGCGHGRASAPTPQGALANLPTAAWIDCTGDPNLDRGAWYLWELPGVKPSDPNSAYRGDTGRSMGALAACTRVEALECAWSETDREFYVLVACDDLRGWISADLLLFTAPPAVGPPCRDVAPTSAR